MEYKAVTKGWDWSRCTSAVYLQKLVELDCVIHFVFTHLGKRKFDREPFLHTGTLLTSLTIRNSSVSVGTWPRFFITTSSSGNERTPSVWSTSKCDCVWRSTLLWHKKCSKFVWNLFLMPLYVLTVSKVCFRILQVFWSSSLSKSMKTSFNSATTSFESCHTSWSLTSGHDAVSKPVTWQLPGRCWRWGHTAPWSLLPFLESSLPILRPKFNEDNSKVQQRWSKNNNKYNLIWRMIETFTEVTRGRATDSWGWARAALF